MRENIQDLFKIVWMMSGRHCKYKHQDYLVTFKDGKFITPSGTRIGNIRDLQIVKPKGN